MLTRLSWLARSCWRRHLRALKLFLHGSNATLVVIIHIHVFGFAVGVLEHASFTSLIAVDKVAVAKAFSGLVTAYLVQSLTDANCTQCSACSNWKSACHAAVALLSMITRRFELGFPIAFATTLTLVITFVAVAVIALSLSLSFSFTFRLSPSFRITLSFAAISITVPIPIFVTVAAVILPRRISLSRCISLARYVSVSTIVVPSRFLASSRGVWWECLSCSTGWECLSCGARWEVLACGT
jgi:hypothetical protein